MDTLQLSNVTKDCITEIQLDLLKINDTGIFFAPELYIAFKLGIAYSNHKLEIFGIDKVEWLRETNFRNGGPTDLAFKNENSIFLFELKIASKLEKYVADIKKLKRADSNFKKYFIALADSFSEFSDNRLIGLETKFGDKLIIIGKFSFATNRHKTQPFCVTKIYEIK